MVLIDGAGTEVDDTTGTQHIVDHIREDVVAVRSVTIGAVAGEGRIEDRELG